MQKINVSENKDYSKRFPNEMTCDIIFYMNDGKQYRIDKTDYEGFVSRKASWDTVAEKFKNLSNPFIDEATQHKIIEMVQNLEDYKMKDLMTVLNTYKNDHATV